jgi:hypothetical protein
MDTRAFGCDTSLWCGKVDYSIMARAGAKFVYAKASQLSEDPTFQTYWHDAKTAGLLRGAFEEGTGGIGVTGRGAGQTNIADYQNNSKHVVVDYAYATGANLTFTWTLGSSATWDAVAVATKSA